SNPNHGHSRCNRHHWRSRNHVRPLPAARQIARLETGGAEKTLSQGTRRYRRLSTLAFGPAALIQSRDDAPAAAAVLDFGPEKFGRYDPHHFFDARIAPGCP